MSKPNKPQAAAPVTEPATAETPTVEAVTAVETAPEAAAPAEPATEIVLEDNTDKPIHTGVPAAQREESVEVSSGIIHTVRY